MIEEEKNTSEPVDNKTDKKEELTKTQIINLEKIKCPDIDIEKEEPGINVAEVVENKRKALFDDYKKNRKINNIIMVGAVALIVMAFIFIVQNTKALSITGYVVAAATLVGLLVYYFLTKNKFPNKTKEYIKDISLVMNRHVFNDDRFKRMVTNPNTKIDIADITSDRVYVQSTDIGSRNVCDGYFHDVKFRIAELALYKQANRKQRDVVFIGKYISIDNSLKFDGRAIINIKGEKALDLPTDTADLKTVEEDENFFVYGDENFKLSSILSSKAISSLKKIKVKDNLVNVNIVFWGGHTAVYLSYEDAVVSLPFDKPFQGSALDQFTGDLLNVLTILTEM